MKNSLMKDTVMTTVIAGTVASVIQMAISWTLYLTGIIEQNPSLLHARLLSNQVNPNLYYVLLGMLSNLIAGVSFSVVIVLTIKFTGKDFALFKGVVIGLVNASFQYIVLTRLFINPSIVLPNPISELHTYIVYPLWGAIVAYIVDKYSDIKTVR